MLSILCPACGEPGVLLDFHVHTIPYFGEVMESTLLCNRCGYRQVDVQILEEKEPCRYTLKVKGEEDINARVVRSSTGKIIIPELGVEVTPGSDAQGFISNIEGVLERVSDAIKMARNWAEEEEKKKKADELLSRIEDVKEGKEEVTVILEDPFGNSAIISEKAKREKLS